MKDLAHLLELPPAERLQLVEAIWDSLVEVPEAVPVSDEVREELDRRLAAYYADPSSARPWAEIRDELFGTK
ncbi:MAG TPA: addiction module protein [Thermoanaerobaculia bacterium]|nr:addiction module protein [Thermoanaerobaculia bacterium]